MTPDAIAEGRGGVRLAYKYLTHTHTTDVNTDVECRVDGSGTPCVFASPRDFAFLHRLATSFLPFFHFFASTVVQVLSNHTLLMASLDPNNQSDWPLSLVTKRTLLPIFHCPPIGATTPVSSTRTLWTVS